MPGLRCDSSSQVGFIALRSSDRGVSQPPDEEVTVAFDVNRGADEGDCGSQADEAEDDDVFGHRDAGFVLMKVLDQPFGFVPHVHLGFRVGHDVLLLIAQHLSRGLIVICLPTGNKFFCDALQLT